VLDGLALAGLSSVSLERGNRTFVAEKVFLFDIRRETLVRWFSDDTTIEMIATVKAIGRGRFAHCENALTAVVLGPNMARIEEKTFFGTKVPSVMLPITICYIGPNPFPVECKIAIPKGETSKGLFDWRADIRFNQAKVFRRMTAMDFDLFPSTAVTHFIVPTGAKVDGMTLKQVLAVQQHWFTPTQRAITIAGLAVALRAAKAVGMSQPHQYRTPPRSESWPAQCF
jgi:hypothetical protein